MEEISFRLMHIEDYEKVINLWKECNLKIETNGTDSYESIRKSLNTMPQLHFLAEKNNEIIAVIIGSYDYRKGYLNRLAVKEEYRRQGIAKKLISHMEKELNKLGAKRIEALIFKDNLISKKLLKTLGYEPAHNVLYLTKSVN